MKIEIDVDLGQYAAEWEAVAFRVPKNGEWILTDMGLPLQIDMEGFTRPRLVIRRKWKWPEWLKAEYIAMDANGRWFAYPFEPQAGMATWNVGGHSLLPLSMLKQFLDFTPPAVPGWKESLIRNPNLQPFSEQP